MVPFDDLRPSESARVAESPIHGDHDRSGRVTGRDDPQQQSSTAIVNWQITPFIRQQR
jgi:hypothetical protein